VGDRAGPALGPHRRGVTSGEEPPVSDHPEPVLHGDVDLDEAERLLSGSSGRELLRTAAEHAGTRLVYARLRSIHERAGRSVSYVHVAVLASGEDRREVVLVAHADRRPLPADAFVLTADGLPVAVWRFPHDPYLPGLPSAVSPERVRGLLDVLNAPEGDVTVHTRAYRPSRRAVVEVTVHGMEATGRVLYLKALTGDRATELADLHRQLGRHLPVPRVVGVDARQGLLALQALEGRTLRAALVEGAPLPDPCELRALSERFATSDLSSHRDPLAFADPSRHVGLLSRLVPDRADTVREVATAAAVPPRAPLVPVHGDLHDGQLLLDPDGRLTGLLDVDGAGLGTLAHDAGTLVAHLAVLGEVWPQVTDRAETYAAAVADAYRPLVGTDLLARATAGAWLGLATGPHRAQDEGWLARTRARIDRARRELG
jgi:hypothetical protein